MLPKVVAGHVQRTLARPAVIGPPQPRVAVVAFRARVARVPHRVVLTRAALSKTLKYFLQYANIFTLSVTGSQVALCPLQSHF